MSDEEAQAIVDQALKSGSIEQRNTLAVVVGIAGSAVVGPAAQIIGF